VPKCQLAGLLQQRRGGFPADRFKNRALGAVTPAQATFVPALVLISRRAAIGSGTDESERSGSTAAMVGCSDFSTTAKRDRRQGRS
jgi:hypothetical protein